MNEVQNIQAGPKRYTLFTIELKVSLQLTNNEQRAAANRSKDKLLIPIGQGKAVRTVSLSDAPLFCKHFLSTDVSGL